MRSDPVNGIYQVITLIIVILHISIPGKFQGITAFYFVAREDGVDMLHNHILEEHNIVLPLVLRKFQKSGKIMIGWNLDDSITLLLIVFVAVPADHFKGQIGLTGFHKGTHLLFYQENRLNGCDNVGIENIPDKTTLLFCQLILIAHYDYIILAKLGDDLLLKNQVKYRLLVGYNLIDLPYYACRIDGFEMLFGEFRFVPEHLSVVADPYLVKLFRIIGVDSQKFYAFIQGQGFVHGFLEYPEIEGEPADITVGVFVFSHKVWMNIQM
jgi:hypothetical protein